MAGFGPHNVLDRRTFRGRALADPLIEQTTNSDEQIEVSLSIYSKDILHAFQIILIVREMIRDGRCTAAERNQGRFWRRRLVVKGCLASLFVEKVVKMMRCMTFLMRTVHDTVDGDDEDLMMMVVVAVM